MTNCDCVHLHELNHNIWYIRCLKNMSKSTGCGLEPVQPPALSNWQCQEIVPLRSVRLWRAIKGKWWRLAARMTKPVTTEGLQDSPHLFWSPWKQGQERSGTREPRIDRHKGREKHASCYWQFTDRSPDVFKPPGIKVLFICYKFRLGHLGAHLMPPVFRCLSSIQAYSRITKYVRHNCVWHI